ncbi:extracellular solute-binding protein [Paenibacillus hodogayensis]|uniref:Extracellular solute-binding protein n=1 Tax=Paenibacillus hodogayensis TaxID=279208 RepID=A0ABV5VU03_9BACL
MDTTHTTRKSFGDRLRWMIDSLRGDIRNGTYKPGDYLPSEKTLVEQFHLSNKSVRKGLDALVGEGLIVKIDRVGSRVSEDAPGSRVSIALGCTGSIERDIALSALLDDFHLLHPAIRVRTVLVRSMSDHMSTAQEYIENGMIDAFTLNNLDFQSGIENGRTHMLDPLSPDPHAYPFAQQAFMHDGTLLARPLIFSPIVLAYNRDHFLEADAPEPDGSWTWDDAVRVAAALTEPGKRHGLYFYLLSDNRWPALLLQSGMRFDEDGAGVTDPSGSRMLDCIRLCKRLVHDRSIFPSYLSENSDDVNELFMQGKVSMILTNYMTINEFKHTGLTYDISPLPYSHEPRSLMNVIGIGVSKASKQRDAASKLADYMASPRAQRLIREKTLSLPAVKQVAESPVEPDDAINRPSRYYLFREIMSSYRLHKELGLSTGAFVALRQLLKKYWSNLIEEEELCRQLALLPGQERLPAPGPGR